MRISNTSEISSFSEVPHALNLADIVYGHAVDGSEKNVQHDVVTMNRKCSGNCFRDH